MTRKTKPVFALKATLVMAGLAVSLPSWADNPLGLLLSQSLTYDSNILKNDRDKRRDAVSSTAVKGFFQKDYGRQSYSVAATGIFQRYKDTKDFDNDGYQVDLGFSSELGANGVIGFDHSAGRSLQDLGGQGRERFKETVTSQSTSLEGRYGLYGRWGLSGSINRDTTKYEVRPSNDRIVVGARAGLRYTPSDLLFFDFGIKKSNAEQKNLTIFYFENRGDVFGKLALGDKIDRTDLNLISQWIVTGYSSLDAQIGFTQERHEKDFNRDFNGFTGRVSWRYTPRGKISYSLAFDRDTNNAGGASGIIPLETSQGILGDSASQKRLSTGIQGNATWAATSKISATVGIGLRRLEEENITIGRPPEFSSGNYRNLSMGLKYIPTRALSFGCSLSVYKRDGTALSAAYSGETFGCNAGFLIN